MQHIVRRPQKGSHLRDLRPGRLALTVVLTVWSGVAIADPSDLCVLAARDASQINNVPLSVLIAVTQTETGRSSNGEIRPWPWTVNIEGEGHWFPDRSTALAYAQAAFDRGARSFDIGCFQVNYRWHGGNFVSIDQMFDPMANATYAAGFLAKLRDETGDWSAAAGAYHRRTPEYATRYRAKFEEFRSAAIAAGADDGTMQPPVVLASAGADGADTAPGLPRVNSFLLLQQSAAPRAMGSLVPLSNGG